MSGSVQLLNKNYTEAAVASIPQVAQTENKTHREAQTSSEASTTKAAQAINDSVIATGKTVSQVVMEHSDASVKKMEHLDALRRDLDVSPVKSALGTTADENRVPSEINTKPTI